MGACGWKACGRRSFFHFLVHLRIHSKHDGFFLRRHWGLLRWCSIGCHRRDRVLGRCVPRQLGVAGRSSELHEFDLPELPRAKSFALVEARGKGSGCGCCARVWQGYWRNLEEEVCRVFSSATPHPETKVVKSSRMRSTLAALALSSDPTWGSSSSWTLGFQQLV